jgi:hypothetical protein
MDDQILASYGLCTAFLTARHQAADRQHNMPAAEVMTTALVAIVFCGGNCEPARARLGTSQDMPMMRSRSRFNRRLHLIQDRLVTRLNCLGEAWKALHVESVSSMDRLPVAMCDNDRIPRAKLDPQEVYRGYIASTQRYF